MIDDNTILNRFMKYVSDIQQQHQILIEPIRFINSGAENAIIKIKAPSLKNLNGFVIRFNTHKHKKSDTTVQILNKLQGLIPTIYYCDESSMMWAITDYCKPLSIDCVDIIKYSTTIFKILEILHHYEIGYFDWKIQNFMTVNGHYVLVDYDFNKMNKHRFLSTYRKHDELKQNLMLLQSTNEILKMYDNKKLLIEYLLTNDKIKDLMNYYQINDVESIGKILTNLYNEIKTCVDKINLEKTDESRLKIINQINILFNDIHPTTFNNIVVCKLIIEHEFPLINFKICEFKHIDIIECIWMIHVCNLNKQQLIMTVEHIIGFINNKKQDSMTLETLQTMQYERFINTKYLTNSRQYEYIIPPQFEINYQNQHISAKYYLDIYIALWDILNVYCNNNLINYVQSFDYVIRPIKIHEMLSNSNCYLYNLYQELKSNNMLIY